MHGRLEKFCFGMARLDNDASKRGSGRRAVAAAFPHVLAYTLELSFFAKSLAKRRIAVRDAAAGGAVTPTGSRKRRRRKDRRDGVLPSDTYPNSCQWYMDIGHALGLAFGDLPLFRR